MKAISPAKLPYQKELLVLLKELVQLHSVYIIGMHEKKSNHDVYLTPQNKRRQKIFVSYTLLIIGQRPISKNHEDFMQEVYAKTQRRCKIYPITYALSNILKRLNYGDNFLTRTLSQAVCIFKKNEALSKFNGFKVCLHETVYMQICDEWNNRMRRAGYLLSTVELIYNKEDQTSKLAILHYAMEQVCLALLYVYWEFKPNNYSLSYLFHLCGHVSTLPCTVFPRDSYGLQRLYYMLCNAHHLMRFKSEDEFSVKDSDKAYNRCERFYKEAKSIGETKLVHLKEIHCHSSNYYRKTN